MTVEHCEKVREDLPALHYGDLEGAERASIERHLGECAPCRAALEAVRETAAGLDRIPVPVPTDSDWVRLDARIESRVAPLRAARFARSYGRFSTFARIASITRRMNRVRFSSGPPYAPARVRAPSSS